MYGLGQFHHRQNKEEERRGKIWQKKAYSSQKKGEGRTFRLLAAKKQKINGAQDQSKL